MAVHCIIYFSAVKCKSVMVQTTNSKAIEAQRFCVVDAAHFLQGICLIIRYDAELLHIMSVLISCLTRLLKCHM